jgi:hypothetical protein
MGNCCGSKNKKAGSQATGSSAPPPIKVENSDIMRMKLNQVLERLSLQKNMLLKSNQTERAEISTYIDRKQADKVLFHLKYLIVSDKYLSEIDHQIATIKVLLTKVEQQPAVKINDNEFNTTSKNAIDLTNKVDVLIQLDNSNPRVEEKDQDQGYEKVFQQHQITETEINNMHKKCEDELLTMKRTQQQVLVVPQPMHIVEVKPDHIDLSISPVKSNYSRQFMSNTNTDEKMLAGFDEIPDEPEARMKEPVTHNQNSLIRSQQKIKLHQVDYSQNASLF